MSLRVTRAESPEALLEIQRFRYSVYVDEMGKPIAHADHDRQVLADPEDATGQVFACHDDAGLIGTIRLATGPDSPDEAHAGLYRLDLFPDVARTQAAFASRFMLRSDHRGGLAAHRLCLAALDAALDADIRLVFCHCAPYLVGYYEQLGFRRYTDNFHDALGYRVPMVLVLRDKAHLEAVRSPLAARIPDPVDEAWGGWFGARFPDFVFPANARLVATDAFYELLNRKLHDDPRKTIPLLRGLEQEEADAVLRAGTILGCADGDRLLREGELSGEIYLNLSALVGIRHPDRQGWLSLLGPGELIGEMAFLMSSRRTADVTVIRGGEILLLSERTLKRLMDERPEAASKVLFNLAKILCERLASTTRSLVDTARQA
ncbi:MAG: cyclic nucleotide-binding domain-containing protein [Candidatus Sericytochromatia bacterium]|nr:cyclic nucleotide-binding domain-containing protein [Candidatus Sericytochromatia bacterium]